MNFKTNGFFLSGGSIIKEFILPWVISAQQSTKIKHLKEFVQFTVDYPVFLDFVYNKFNTILINRNKAKYKQTR